MKRYTPEFREQLAREVERLPDNSAIVRALSDYAVTRDKIRACIAAAEKLK